MKKVRKQASLRLSLVLIPDTGVFLIDKKSISRKHLTISLATVQPGDGVNY